MPNVSLDLTGEWHFREYPLEARRMRDLDSSDWHRTHVPCSIFNSLLESGQIKQYEIDTLPEKFSWVSEKPWVYRKIFDAPDNVLNCDCVELVFAGLDTITNIWLNDKLIGRTNNMFIPFRFDVTNLLKPKDNSLLVKFEPAIQYAKNLMNRYTSSSQTDFINPHRVYIRKAQYQFGWDFCPPLPGCGIWQGVYLEGIKKTGLADLHIRTLDCNTQYADVKITIELSRAINENLLCRLNISDDRQTIEHNLTFKPGEDSNSTVIRIEQPLLWWPAGYGDQHLYQLECQLVCGDEIIYRTNREFGVRTVNLRRTSDEHSEGFQFEVNGQPIFASGANWIPASIFAGSVSSKDYEKLLSAANECNINMLRIWGGGYYEADEFYKLCDRFGIMVWQDFMFACAYYPDRKWFLDEVKTEATEIIKRLRNHPCLALWCGNNEIDRMHSTGRLGKGKKFYGKAIYHQILPELVAEFDGGTDYIPTTPLGEKNNFKNNKLLTVHQWDVWSGHQPARSYLCAAPDVPQFVTEFGMQSLPCMETIQRFCPSDKLRIGTWGLEKHNYQTDGNSRLYRYVSDLFGTAKDIEHLIYLSQITQARGIKVYVEHLRAHNFRNKGVLFWQFNDCCPAISWSAIDYARKPKAVYYYAKRFFSRLLTTVVSGPNEPEAGLDPSLRPASVIVINDTSQPLTATLNCRLIDLFGNLLDRTVFPIAIGPFSTSAQLKLPKAFIFPLDPAKSVLHLLLDKDSEEIVENLFFYLPDKYIDWPEAKITMQFHPIKDKRWKLQLNSNAVAKDVQVSGCNLIRLSDNFIDLLPNRNYEVTVDFEGQPGLPEDAICVRSVKSAF